MYRLLKLQKLCSLQSISVSSPLNNQYSMRTCLLCEHNFAPRFQNLDLPHCPEPRRYLSTKTSTIQQNSNLKMKKKRRSTKKYAELLEVTGNSSSETKASVSNLKPKHFSLLVDQPNISLAQLHNLKKSKGQILREATLAAQRLTLQEMKEPAILMVGNHYNVDSLEDGSCISLEDTALLNKIGLVNEDKTSTFEDVELEHLENHLQETGLQNPFAEVVEDAEIADLKEVEDLLGYHEESIANLVEPIKDAFTNVKGQKKATPSYKTTSLKKSIREKMAKVKQEELDQAGKAASLARSLHSYLDICVACGLTNRGFSTLSFYRQRSKRFKDMPRVTDVALYNILLHAFAGKGNVGRVKEILQFLSEDDIAPNAQTHAACFEAVGRLDESPASTKLLNRWHADMARDGFALNDLMTECRYSGDQREVVLGVIRRVEPGFEPRIPPPDICYSCNLLQDLNPSRDEYRAAGFKSPVGGIFTSEELKAFSREQIEIEMKDYIKVKTIEKRSEPNENIIYYRSKLEERQTSWRQTITEAFQRDLNAFRAQHHSFKTFRHLNLYPYLRALDPHQYTDIVMQEIRKLSEGSETFSPTTNQLYRELGSKVRARYQVKFKVNSGVMEKVERLYEDYCDWYLEPGDGTSLNTRQRWQQLVHSNREGPNVNLDEKQWPNTVLIGVGKFLYNIIMRDIKIDVNVTRANSKTQNLLPAFYTLFRTQGRFLKEEVKPHPILSRLYRGAAQEELVFDVTSVPMLSPPVPWSSVTSGGYLVAKAEIIRLPQQAVQQWQRLIDTPAPQLFPVLDSLNQLGAVPWTVNQPVLDVVVDVFNAGGSLPLDIPSPPSACPAPDSITPDMSKLERFQAYRNRMALRRRKAEMYSLWCDSLYRLSLANHFRGRVFWLPHNIDFRGRVYPCPPHLNHLGSDMARSILCFAKGEPLGPKGLDWLKIHLVNLTGLKKREPVSERLIYAEELLPEIIDSAQNPLNGRMWWAESEEPWQTLACCMEIERALKSGAPERYVCHFPVHQDGSCNGLQHYAALGRDRVGAQSVNLTPAIRPQDVYSCVAQLVERERAKDAAEGVKVAQVLDGFIRRKVIKQTVMTTVYGVTRFGARLQIARQLKDIDNFPKEFVWSGSTYLVGKTFDSIREMFTSTKEIQDWFTECARLISQVCGQNVEWVTPLGLPVVQPYNRFNKRVDVQSKGTNKLQEHYATDMFERPNVMKQKNAFPPNFIHSLDSSHMMLTSLYCERKGISFVSVHDCFWTHPSTVDTMNKVCREQFVSLHAQPILEDLSKFLVNKYGYAEKDLPNDGSVIDMTKRRLNLVLNQLPQTGDFCLDSVLKSVYFFS